MHFLRFLSSDLVVWAFRFWFRHFGVISFWMLFAALGRAVQMRFFGPISSPLSISLEVIVEVARIVTLLAIIGCGSLSAGIRKVAGIYRSNRQQWSDFGRKMRLTLRQFWPVLLWNLLVFSLIAFGFNRVNGLLADHSAVLPFLKKTGVMQASATSMPIVFFLKNLTVIPFTLVFDYTLVRWLVDKRGVTNAYLQTGA
ncbi:hypothetical protein [Larkinella rosea]|uniref:Uncharacterized protein n=1 Tax=Larkinella rosea TaxID=2025312 RepID=A0A3P1C2U8_9BACT|nr:hypothetical protein [Larkinella rosea]RRB07383.1 hypothetical protein EHT25_06280 [Larkinella rosea]